MSNDMPAWEARSARDWGMVDNDLSEKIDARRVGYDVQLTNEGLDQVERINNRPPNLPQAMEYVLKYGQSGDGQGYGGIDGQAGGNATAATTTTAAAAPQRKPHTVYPAMNARAAAAMGRGMQAQYGQGVGGGAMRQPVYNNPVGPVVDDEPQPTSKQFRERLRQQRQAAGRLRQAKKNKQPISAAPLPLAAGGLGSAAMAVAGSMPNSLKKSNPRGTAQKNYAAWLKRKKIASMTADQLDNHIFLNL
jgi:hypothetical protein